MVTSEASVQIVEKYDKTRILQVKTNFGVHQKKSMKLGAMNDEKCDSAYACRKINQ